MKEKKLIRKTLRHRVRKQFCTHDNISIMFVILEWIPPPCTKVNNIDEGEVCEIEDDIQRNIYTL